MSRPLVRIAFWIPVLLLVPLDLITKSWAHDTLRAAALAEPQIAPFLEGAPFPIYPPLPVCGDWLALEWHENPGGVFGSMQSLTGPLTCFRGLAVIALIWFATRLPTGRRRTESLLGLLTAGAVGNLYDNLSFLWGTNGFVRDWIRVDLGPAPGFWPDFLPWVFHPWPIFNVADICISIGFFDLLFGLADFSKESDPGPDASQSPPLEDSC